MPSTRATGVSQHRRRKRQQSLARDTRQALWEAAAKAVQSMIAAIRGDQVCAESCLGDAEAVPPSLGASAILADIQLARTLLALGDGRYDEAFQHLQRTFEPHDPAHHPVRSFWRIGDYTEATIRDSHVNQARQQLARSESLGQQAPSPRLQIGLLYARPLLADDDTAEAHFQAALGANLTSWPLYRVRLLLEYGTWLRHRRRIAAARKPLRARHATRSRHLAPVHGRNGQGKNSGPPARPNGSPQPGSS